MSHVLVNWDNPLICPCLLTWNAFFASNCDPQNPNVWCSLGVLYYQLHQNRDALDAYTRAIKLDPHLCEVRAAQQQWGGGIFTFPFLSFLLFHDRNHILEVSQSCVVLLLARIIWLFTAVSFSSVSTSYASCLNEWGMHSLILQNTILGILTH